MHVFGKKQLFITVICISLIAFGIIGAVISFGAIYPLNAGWFDATLGFGSSIKSEFGSISTTMQDASITSTNAGTSLRNGEASLKSGSIIVNDISNTFYNIASPFNVDIFPNWCPFCSISGYFNRQGNKFFNLASNLEITASSLESNAQNMEKLSSDFKDMSNKLNDVSNNFEILASWRIKQILTGILIYIGTIHLMFVLTGFSILLLKKAV